MLASSDLVETLVSMVDKGGPFALALVFLVLTGMVSIKYIVRPLASIVRTDVIDPIGNIEDKRTMLAEKENERLRVSKDITETQLKIAETQRATAEFYASIRQQ